MLKSVLAAAALGIGALLVPSGPTAAVPAVTKVEAGIGIVGSAPTLDLGTTAAVVVRGSAIVPPPRVVRTGGAAIAGAAAGNEAKAAPTCGLCVLR
jgi:hypothetical protein